MKYKLKIWECNSKGQEKIADILFFETRIELNEFIKNLNLDFKPYKMQKKTKGYSITA